MSRVLFVNGNLHGHFNPTLPLVTQLVKQGEEVWYYCSDLFRDKVESVGAHFIPTGKRLNQFYQEYRPTGEHPFYKLMEYMVRYDQVLLPDLLEQTKDIRFDYVIYDSILGGGYFLKNIMNVPFICSNSSFVMNKLPVPDSMLVEGCHPQLDGCYRVIRELSSVWKTKEPSLLDVFINKGNLNLVYTSRAFNPEGEQFDDSYLFIGPSMDERMEETDFPFTELEGYKVIYISLGTINTDFNQFYQLCLSTFASTEYKVVMSVGKKCNINDLGQIPDNFIVKQHVPQLELLKRSHIFISHSGFNSVSESLYYGVPLILLPMVNDQYMVASRLTQLGAGIMLKMSEVTNKLLMEAVGKIESNNGYKTACMSIGNSFRRADSCKKTVEIMKDYVRKWNGNKE